MVAAGILTEKQARDLSEPVLARVLGEAGFDHVEVYTGPDHDGDDALFIVAVLKSGSPMLSPDAYANAYGAVDDTLRGSGERRFSYFKVSRPDEPIFDDETEQ